MRTPSKPLELEFLVHLWRKSALFHLLLLDLGQLLLSFLLLFFLLIVESIMKGRWLDPGALLLLSMEELRPLEALLDHLFSPFLHIYLVGPFSLGVIQEFIHR